MPKFRVSFSTVETYDCYVEVEAANAAEVEERVDH